MNTSTTPVGRPRAFDLDTALEKALEVFWQKGYEGASLPDLTAAMGINKPSLYAAFGNKEQLFLKAIERYEQQHAQFFYGALELPTAYQVAEQILLGAAREHAKAEHPRGCLVVQGALACSDDGQGVKQALIERRRQSFEQLVQRFVRAQQQGDLATEHDPKVLAGYILTVIQGIAVQSTSCQCPQLIEQIARQALEAFPTTVSTSG